MTSEKAKNSRQIYNKETYYWCKEHKICVHCKKEDVPDGRAVCEKCTEKQRVRYRNLSDTVKAERISVQKARYWARREANVCIDCGGGLAETSKFFCPKHLKMRRIRENRYYYKRKAAAENNERNTGAGG